MADWSRALDDPIILPDGRELVTPPQRRRICAGLAEGGAEGAAMANGGSHSDRGGRGPGRRDVLMHARIAMLRAIGAER